MPGNKKNHNGANLAMQETYNILTLDVGSNATRLRIFALGGEAAPREVFRHRFPVQLGAGTFSGGTLGPQQEQALVAALKEAAAMGARWDTRKTLAVATSAVRDAVNGVEFLARVQRQTGIAVQIISGAEEAHLMACGAASAHPPGAAASQPFAIIDVGGGSTEIVLLRPPSEMLVNISLELGAVRMAHQWHCRGAMDSQIVTEHLSAVESQVKLAFSRGGSGDDRGWTLPALDPVACALGGTPGALRQMITPQGPQITAVAIANCLQEMAPLTPEQIQQQFGLDPNRAQLILAGAIILQGCLHALGVQAIIPTDRGVCEGLALNYRA